MTGAAADVDGAERKGNAGEAGLLRRLLLGLVLLGSVGLAAELVLLEHTGSAWQWVPLVALAQLPPPPPPRRKKPRPLPPRRHFSTSSLRSSTPGRSPR